MWATSQITNNSLTKNKATFHLRLLNISLDNNLNFTRLQPTLAAKAISSRNFNSSKFSSKWLTISNNNRLLNKVSNKWFHNHSKISTISILLFQVTRYTTTNNNRCQLLVSIKDILTNQGLFMEDSMVFRLRITIITLLRLNKIKITWLSSSKITKDIINSNILSLVPLFQLMIFKEMITKEFKTNLIKFNLDHRTFKN